MRTKRLTVLAFLAAAAAFLPPAVSQGQEADRAIAGMVRQTEIRIGAEVSGRLESLKVARGDKVRKGDLLAVLDNPDLTALVGEAQAAAASARAEREKIYSGVRPEDVAIAEESVQTAKANLVLARQQNDRAVALLAKNTASRKAADEAAAALAQAEADLALMQAEAAAARAGPTAEERALADARVKRAEAAVALLVARHAKTQLVAPVDGTIGIRVCEPGEILSPGKPVLTMTVDDGPWFAFTLREDELRGLTVGSAVSLTAPGGRTIAARVTELRPLGEFATWRAARAVGDHDLNSFRLRLDAVEGAAEGLEAGMTVWLDRRP